MDNNLDGKRSNGSELTCRGKLVLLPNQHHITENDTSKTEGAKEKSYDVETSDMFVCEDGGRSTESDSQFIVTEDLIVGQQETVTETPDSSFLEEKTDCGQIMTDGQAVTLVSEQAAEVEASQSGPSQSVVYMPVNFVSEEGIGMSDSAESVLVIQGEGTFTQLPTALSDTLTEAEMTSIQIVVDAAGQVISANQNISPCQVTATSSAGTEISQSEPIKTLCLGGQDKGSSLGDNRSPPILFQVLTEDGMLHNINLDPVTTAADDSADNLECENPKQDIVTVLQNADKPFYCDLCSASFSRLGNYTRHRMIHTIHMKEDYRYKCEQCGRVFLQRCDLNRHMDIHRGTFPYTCGTCGKGYIRNSDLVVHERFHNKDRSFKCMQCPKAFYQSGDLRRHVRQVHEQVKPLTCGHCQRKFSKEATLIRHMQTVHRDIILTSLSNKFPLPLEVQKEISTSSSPNTLILEKSSEGR